MLRIVAILCFFLLSTVVHAYEFVVTNPVDAVVSGTFNVTGTFTAGANEEISFAGLEIYNDSGVAYSATNIFGCLGLPVCTADYQALNGAPLDLPHGSYSIRPKAFVHITDPPNVPGATQYGTPQSVFVDRTPSLTVSSAPTGSVSYPLRATGTATFTPTLMSTKGTVEIQIDGKSVTSYSCTADPCTFDLSANESAVSMSGIDPGTHTLTVVAESFGAEKRSEDFAVTLSESGEVPTDPDDITRDEFPRDPNLEICGNSTFNVLSGAVTHSQPLFAAQGGLMPLSVGLYYNSNAPSGPLGPGWSHSYDMKLHLNTDGTRVLIGGGLSTRFYTPDGSGGYTPESGDSSLLYSFGDGYLLSFRDGTVLRFTSTGNIGEIYDRYGNATMISGIVGHQKTVVTLPGKTATINYDDTDSRIISIIDPAQNIYSFVYDTENRLAEVHYPKPTSEEESSVWKYRYNADNRMVAKTDPAGFAVKYQYDEAGRLIRSVDGDHMEDGDANGDGVVNIVDALVVLRDVVGRQPLPIEYRKFADIAPMNAEGVSEPDGKIDIGDVLSIIRRAIKRIPLIPGKEMGYQSDRTLVKELNGASWVHEYDRNIGALTAITDPLGNTTRYTHYVNGMIETETVPVKDGEGYRRTYVYDPYGNVTHVTGRKVNLTTPESLGPIDYDYSYTYDYNAYDQIASETNNLDSPPTTISYSYTTDIDGTYLITRTDQAGKLSVTRLNANGTVASTLDGDQRPTLFQYDGEGNLSAVTNPDLTFVEYADLNGLGLPQTIKLRDVSTAIQQTTTIGYDALGRIRRTSQPGASEYITRFGYDANGNRTLVTDANGKSTVSAHNSKGKVIRITDAIGKDTSFEYGAGCRSCSGINQSITAVEDANGNRTNYAYDAAGRLERETDPLLKAIRYTYYPNGLMKEKINAQNEQVLVTYAYDHQGRLIRKDFGDGRWQEFVFYPGGQLWMVVNQDSSLAYEWYPNGWLKKVTDSAGRVVEYAEYTDGGQRKTVKVLAGTAEEKIVSYGYDTKKRLATISLSGIAGEIRFTYDSLGRRQTLSYPNGVVATYAYHPEQPNWLTGVNYAKDSAAVYEVSYPEVDMVGNRKAKSEDAQGVGYIYDDVYRLLAVSGSQVEAFTYDAAGNRLTEAGEAYTIGAGNQVTAAKGEGYTYDDLGNTTRAGERIYTWNDAGELIRAQGPTADVSFKYDATGRRIQKAVVGGATRDYIYDAEDIAVEYIDGVPTFYLHGPETDEPLAMLRGGQAYFFHADGLGSVVRITDSTGAVVKSITYSSFGKVVAETGNFVQPYGFTGRERDAETGLSYHRARYYDPAVGRWLSRDPLSFGGGDVVLDGYVGQNPVNLADPSGMVPPVIAAGLYYGGAKLLALGTAWAGFKVTTTSMSKSNIASKAQACMAQSAAISGLKKVAVINTAGAPLSFAPGASVMAASPVYTSAMVAAGTPAGQNLLNNVPDFIDAWMPGDNPVNQSPGGFWGWATKSGIEFGRFIENQINQSSGR